MASICNDEQASCGVMSGHDRQTLASRPGELLANRAFVLKMGLLMLAGLNAAAFHVRDGLQRQDRTARAQTALSLGLWLTVIIYGRWIAYL
jgi:hypothetical protein